MTHTITSLEERTFLAIKDGHQSVNACAVHTGRNSESTRARLMKLTKMGLLFKDMRDIQTEAGSRPLTHFRVSHENYRVDDSRPSLPYGTHPLYPMMAAIRAMSEGATTCIAISDATEYGVCRTRALIKKMKERGLVSTNDEGFVPRKSAGIIITPTHEAIQESVQFFDAHPDARRYVSARKKQSVTSFDAMDKFLRRPV